VNTKHWRIFPLWIWKSAAQCRRTREPVRGYRRVAGPELEMACGNRLLRFELDPSARIGTLDAIWVWVR